MLTLDVATATAITADVVKNDKPTRRHISTTHNERYYHLTEERTRTVRKTDKKTGTTKMVPITEQIGYATVFFRQEAPRATASPTEDWYASVALCDHRDQFTRRSGRAVARRKYFSGKFIRIPAIDAPPTYEMAVVLADAALKQRK